MANGGIIGTVNTPTSTTATGVWQQEEQYEAKVTDTWPQRALFTTNSCRFNAPDDAYMHFTPSSSGSRRIGTFSIWVKLALNTPEGQYLFSGSPNATTETSLLLSIDGDNLRFNGWTSNSQHMLLVTNRKFRDPSAYYHIVVAWDTTQGTASNRVKIYINGVQETSFSTETYPNQNTDLNINNSGNKTLIGARSTANYAFADGYYSEVIMIDGTQLAPTSFGVANSDGVWTPIPYTGTFGTNGFNLQFQNSAALGTDSSPNGNTFTVSNLTSIDQSTDYPVVNYATLNPLNSSSNDSHTPPTYSEGNLQSASPSSGGGYVGSSTIGVTNGKWFWEFKKSGGSATNIYNGIGNVIGTAEIARNSSVGLYYGNQVFYRPDGTKQIVTNGSNANSSYGASWTTNDIIGIALDLDSSTNTITFYKNGASQGAINLPVNTDTWFFIAACGTDTVDTWQLNFGSPPYAISSGNADGNGYGNFEYAVPSGYYAINTANLAEFG